MSINFFCIFCFTQGRHSCPGASCTLYKSMAQLDSNSDNGYTLPNPNTWYWQCPFVPIFLKFHEVTTLERELKSPAAHLPWFMEGKNAYLLSKCDPLWRKRRAKLNKVLEFHWKKSVHNSTIDSVTAECRGSNDLFTFLETFFLVGKSNGTFDNLNFLEIFFFDSDPSFWKKGIEQSIKDIERIHRQSY